MEWFLSPDNVATWTKVRALAAENTPASYETLQKHVLEAGRFQSMLHTTRICQGETCQIKDDEGDTFTVNEDEIILVNNTALNRDPSLFPSPNDFKVDRLIDSCHMFGYASHACVGRSIAIVTLTSMVKVAATLKGLRQAPGPQGQIKYVPGKLGNKQWLSDDWSKFQPFPGSWKVHFDEL